ncbi:MAG: hypothetical protein ACTSR2_00380 [Candidatus Hodarchaeales archaeon]
MRNDIELKPYQEKKFDIELDKLYVIKLNSSKLTKVNFVSLIGNDIMGSFSEYVDTVGIRKIFSSRSTTIAITNTGKAEIYGYLEELT